MSGGADGRMSASLLRSLRSPGVARNGLFSALQSLTTIVCVFLSYRILIAEAGLSGLGLWSLLMMFAGMAQTFDVSGASALARSVARHEHETPEARLAEVVHTVLLTSCAINAVLMLVLLAAAPAAIDALVAPESKGAAFALLPWVAVIVLTLPLSVGVAAAIDGTGRADQRAQLMAGAAVAGLAVAWIAIPMLGLVGLAIAQLCQQGLVVAGGWILLRRHVPGLGFAPRRWRRSVFLKTTGYAVRLNTAGVLVLLFDPLVKFCLNAIGGLSALGIYELASRLVVQIRALVIGATTPLIPAFAASAALDQHRFDSLLGRSMNFASLAAPGVAVATLAAAPIMSIVILGSISVPLLQATAVLALGWSLNILSLPLYLAAQAGGLLRWNMMSHVVQSIAVVLATVLIVPVLSTNGVLIGVSAGLVLGAAVTIVGNARPFGATPALLRAAPRMSAASVLVALGCLASWLVAPLVAG